MMNKVFFYIEIHILGVRAFEDLFIPQHLWNETSMRAHFPRVGKHRGEEKTAASTVSGVLELLFSDIIGKMDRVHLIPMSQGDFKNLTQQHPVLFKDSVRLCSV